MDHSTAWRNSAKQAQLNSFFDFHDGRKRAYKKANVRKMTKLITKRKDLCKKGKKKLSEFYLMARVVRE